MLIVWIVLCLLIALAAVTWWQPGHNYRAIALTSVAPILYLAAWPCAVVAAVVSDWPAFAVSLALVASHLAFVLPSMHPWATAAPSSGPWRLRTYVHNVLYSNADLTAITAAISQDSPDVVAIVELSHGNAESIHASDALADYPFHAERLSDIGSGCGVWSKVPMTHATFGVEHEHSLFAAVLHPTGRPPITLLVVHTIAPVARGQSGAWARDLDSIGARVRDAEGAVILAGDFNATIPMRRLRRMMRSGQLRDAGTTTGNGWRMTWPAARYLPGLMRIDHVFHSPELTVTDYRLGHPGGSDHRPLVVTLGEADGPSQDGTNRTK